MSKKLVGALAMSGLLKIKDQRDGQLKSWSMYPEQIKVLNSFLLGKNVIVGKIRQSGISTVALFYALYKLVTQPGINVGVVAHNFATSQKLVADLSDFIAQLGLEVTSESKFHIKLNNGSSVRCLTAGSTKIGRGSTYSLLVCSEAGFYENSFEAMAALTATLTTSGQIIIESTATCMDTHFRTTWENKNGFTKLFVGFQSHPNYKIYEDDPRYEYCQLTDEKWEYYRQKYGFTDKSAATWFAWKVAENGYDEVFTVREYPLLPEHMFAQNEGLFVKLAPNIAPYTEHSTNKNIHIYHTPVKDGIYVLSCDPASGGGGDTDNAVVIVWDVKNRRIMASFCSNELTMDKLSDVIDLLHKMYGSKFIIVEKNGLGFAILEFCKKKNLPVIEQVTGNHNQSRLFFWAKHMVEEEGVIADEHLRANCLSCQVIPRTNGGDKFIGSKDFLACLGFLGLFEDKMKTLLPRPPQPPVNPNIFNGNKLLNNGKPKGGIFK